MAVEGEWAHGIWFMVVALDHDRFVAFNTDGQTHVFTTAFPRADTVNWEAA